MRRLLLLLGAIGLVGCAAGVPQPKPDDFPLHAHDQVFLLDYRIDRHPDRVEAVGLITSRSTTTFRFAAVNLYGVTAEDRVVSRGSYVVNGTLGRARVLHGDAHARREGRAIQAPGRQLLARAWHVSACAVAPEVER